MSINDPLGDMLTRIRNAQMRRKGKVATPGSQLRARVLEVLKSEGYIRDYSTTEFGNGRTEFDIELKYYDGQPVIRSIERVSKPGRRVYASVDAMPRVANGLGVTISRPRKASWPTTRRASRTWAAKCFARSSNRRALHKTTGDRNHVSCRQKAGRGAGRRDGGRRRARR